MSLSLILYEFWRKIFLTLYFIKWPSFIVWLGNIQIDIFCFPVCEVINFEINLSFLIKPFFIKVLFIIFKGLSLKQMIQNVLGGWESDFNPFHASFTKWPNTLKQFVGNLPTNCLSVFDHFVGLVLKGLKKLIIKWIVHRLQCGHTKEIGCSNYSTLAMTRAEFGKHENPTVIYSSTL